MIRCVILSLMLVACLATVNAENRDVNLNPAKLETLRELLQKQVDEQHLPSASLLVLHKGSIAFEHHVGLLDLELGTPVAADSLFRIYSMTKPVTAVAAMMLVEQWRLGLDAPISEVLPEFKNLEVYGEQGNTPAEPMTLRHLLAHSAGLTYGYYGNTPVDRMYREAELIDDWDYLVPTTHDLVVGLGKMPLLFQPGERFHYSFASDVLSQVVERVADESFDQHLKRVLWGPLGIQDAYFDVPEGVIDRFGTNHFRTPEGEFTIQDSPRDEPEFLDVTFLSGGGGLVMTVKDFGRFAQLLVDKGRAGELQLIGTNTLEEMFSEQSSSLIGNFKYGLGFGIQTRPHHTNKQHLVELYYWGGASGTWFWVDPENQLAVVFATQLINAPGNLTRLIEDLVYDALEIAN